MCPLNHRPLSRSGHSEKGNERSGDDGRCFVFICELGVVVAITAQYFSSKAAVGFTREMTKDLYDKILSLPKDKRDRIGTSSLVTRLTSDTYQIQVGINQFLRLFLRAPIIVFGSIIMAFTISPKLTLWFLGMVAILTLIIVIMSRIVNPLFAKIRKITDRMVTVTRQQFQGMRVIRAFGQQSSELEDFREVNQDYKIWQIRAGIWSSLVESLDLPCGQYDLGLCHLARTIEYLCWSSNPRDVGRFGQLFITNFNRIDQTGDAGHVFKCQLYFSQACPRDF